MSQDKLYTHFAELRSTHSISCKNVSPKNTFWTQGGCSNLELQYESLLYVIFLSTLPKIFLYKVHIFFWCKMVISRHLNFLHINFSHHCSPNYNQTTQRATFYSPLQLQVNKLERRMFLLAFILILQNNTIFRRIFSFKKKNKTLTMCSNCSLRLVL